MKLSIKLVWVISAFIGALTLSIQGFTHAPEHHKKEGAEPPNCAAMKNMDHSKMDANDPVIQAMMEQCKDWLHDDHEPEHKGDHHKQPDDQHPSNKKHQRQ